MCLQAVAAALQGVTFDELLQLVVDNSTRRQHQAQQMQVGTCRNKTLPHNSEDSGVELCEAPGQVAGWVEGFWPSALEAS